MDKNQWVIENLYECSLNKKREASVTLFLAIPKEEFVLYRDFIDNPLIRKEFFEEIRREALILKRKSPSFENLFKDYSGITLYSELPPWGNLKNTVKNRKNMFDGSSIERVEIDTTSTTSMSRMFKGAKKIDKGNFKYWDTSKVTKKADIECMFKDADIFITQNLKSFLTAKKGEFYSKGIAEEDITCAQ